MTPKERQVHAQPRAGRVKRYVLGLGLGGLCALYGVIALLSGHTFMPGLKGGHATTNGLHAVGLALTYLTGGLYLVVRFFVDPHCRTAGSRTQTIALENMLLVAFIGALLYVLLRVGTAG